MRQAVGMATLAEWSGEGLLGNVEQFGKSWQVIRLGSLVRVGNRLIATVWPVAPCYERMINGVARTMNCVIILRLEMEEVQSQWVVRDKRVVGRS